MSTRRVLISGSILVVLAWVVWTSLSLWQAGSSLSELSPSRLPTTQIPDEVDAAPAAPSASMPVESTFSAPSAVVVSSAIDIGSSGSEVTPRVVPVLSGNISYSSDTSLDNRCGRIFFVHETSIPEDELQYMSPEEFKAAVDSRPFDGQLQHTYAKSLRAAVRGLEPGPASFPSLSDDATIREYDVGAVRGGYPHSAAGLAAIYYEVDKVESNAWWRILLEMGHDPRNPLAVWSQLRGQQPYTDQERRAGADRADELIIDLELLPGLGVREECLTPDELAEQRRHQAELVRRLAQRVMPSTAPGGPAEAFNRLDGHALAVENVCSYSCPTDVQRVIYYQDVPDGGACELIDGVEQTIEAQTAGGRYQNRTFCVPAFLAEY